MSNQTKVTGVVLAGGLARRMGGQDKGLVQYKGLPMIQYALNAMKSVVDEVVINANRNVQDYQEFGYPVISDQTGGFEGPLAGVLSGMLYSDTELLLIIPCDSPLIESGHLQRMLETREKNDAEIAVAFDGERLHPVFLALNRSLSEDLQAYLSSGQRKIDKWLEKHKTTRVDFSDNPDIFQNINTLEELSNLESRDTGC